jgi:hypothetical protein
MLNWISPYVKIFWTKRFVNHRPTSLRLKLKRIKYENRINKRPNLFMVKHKIECLRKPYYPHKPQRRNYNSFYRSVQIPV